MSVSQEHRMCQEDGNGNEPETYGRERGAGQDIRMDAKRRNGSKGQ